MEDNGGESNDVTGYVMIGESNSSALRDEEKEDDAADSLNASTGLGDWQPHPQGQKKKLPWPLHTCLSLYLSSE